MMGVGGQKGSCFQKSHSGLGEELGKRGSKACLRQGFGSSGLRGDKSVPPELPTPRNPGHPGWTRGLPARAPLVSPRAREGESASVSAPGPGVFSAERQFAEDTSVLRRGIQIKRVFKSPSLTFPSEVGFLPSLLVPTLVSFLRPDSRRCPINNGDGRANSHPEAARLPCPHKCGPSQYPPRAPALGSSRPDKVSRAHLLTKRRMAAREPTRGKDWPVASAEGHQGPKAGILGGSWGEGDWDVAFGQLALTIARGGEARGLSVPLHVRKSLPLPLIYPPFVRKGRNISIWLKGGVERVREKEEERKEGREREGGRERARSRTLQSYKYGSPVSRLITAKK